MQAVEASNVMTSAVVQSGQQENSVTGESKAHPGSIDEPVPPVKGHGWVTTLCSLGTSLHALEIEGWSSYSRREVESELPTLDGFTLNGEHLA